MTRILFIIMLIGCSLAGCKKAPTSETVADIWPLRLTLPAGYSHERLQGMDSQVGVIHVTEPKLDIKYDVSPMAVSPQGQKLLKMTRSELTAVVYFEELSLDGVPAYFLGVRIDGSETERRLFLNFPGAGAIFHVDVATPQAMHAAKEAFLHIKVARQPAKINTRGSNGPN